MKMSSLVWAGFSIASLAGCASVPAAQEQSMQLADGEGIAAVQLDTEAVQPQVLLKEMGEKGQELEIRNPPVGQSLYLFKAHSGLYCMTKYYYLGQPIFPRMTGCFLVTPGQLSFSGYLTPKVVDGKMYVDQAFRGDDAETQLKRLYPDVAARFLVAPLPSTLPTISQDPYAKQFAKLEQYVPDTYSGITTWVDHQPHSIQDIYFHNNTDYPAEVTTLKLLDCTNVKQDCNQALPGSTLEPHETKQFTEVEAADHTKSFTFRYDYKFKFHSGNN